MVGLFDNDEEKLRQILANVEKGNKVDGLTYESILHPLMLKAEWSSPAMRSMACCILMQLGVGGRRLPQQLCDGLRKVDVIAILEICKDSADAVYMYTLFASQLQKAFVKLSIRSIILKWACLERQAWEVLGTTKDLFVGPEEEFPPFPGSTPPPVEQTPFPVLCFKGREYSLPIGRIRWALDKYKDLSGEDHVSLKALVDDLTESGWGAQTGVVSGEEVVVKYLIDGIKVNELFRDHDLVERIYPIAIKIGYRDLITYCEVCLLELGLRNPYRVGCAMQKITCPGPILKHAATLTKFH